jgi:hypothetical protein
MHHHEFWKKVKKVIMCSWMLCLYCPWPLKLNVKLLKIRVMTYEIKPPPKYPWNFTYMPKKYLYVIIYPSNLRWVWVIELVCLCREFNCFIWLIAYLS